VLTSIAATIVTSSGGGLFGGTRNAAQRCAWQVKRVAFALLAGHPEQHLQHLPLIGRPARELHAPDGSAEEKLVDVSKGMGQVLTVQRQLFLCLRALVARMPFARLRPFLPFMLTEMACSAAGARL
jgi:hypothetical protein